MSKRKPLVIMNWSMRQNTKEEAIDFAREIVDLTSKEGSVEKVILPSMGTIFPVSEVLAESDIAFGAQNIAPIAAGEMSGEFSIDSLIDMHGKYVEIGHWERRTIFQENHEMINKKVHLTLSKGLTPILCIGEVEKCENSQRLEQLLFLQLFNELYTVNEEDLETLILAYTPQWAVGKTKAASFPYIHNSILLIRESLAKIFGRTAAKKVRVLYGGSVSPENADTMMKNSELDGVLVGRFGSNPERFKEIVEVVGNNT